MSVINKEYKKYLKSNTLFLIIYTVIFLVVYFTFEYIAPFFLGAMIALVISPISTRLQKRYNLNKGITTILLSFLAVITVIVLLVYFIMTSIDSILKLIENISDNYEFFNNAIEELNVNINIYIDRLQNVPNIDIGELIRDYANEVMISVNKSLSKTGEMLTSLPYICLFVITLFMSTYFIAKDIDKLEYRFYNIFVEPVKSKVKKIKRELALSAIGYIKAYTILMAMAFIISLACFKFLKIPYSLILSIVVGLLDLIPFLGIILVYFPLIAYYWIINEKFVAIVLSVVFILLSILREVLEPKLISVNIGISPLSTLIAIFVGIKVNGIVGIIFFLGVLIMHKTLRKVKLI